MSREEIQYKPLCWNYDGADMKVSLTADNVATYVTDASTGAFEVLDDALWRSRYDTIVAAVHESLKHDVSKYCPAPAAVDIYFRMTSESAAAAAQQRMKKPEPPAKDEQGAAESSAATEDTEAIMVREPRWKFSDIYINEKIKVDIRKSMLIARHKQELFEQWRLGSGAGLGRAIVFNFYGPPGTGKSMTAEAIAGELGKKVYLVNYSQLESKYVGETPKNIAKVFAAAKKHDSVLVFDEADSFLGKRLTNVTQSADYGVNITRSVMLMELENFDGIVIFTTNLISNYDEAFKRRILASIPFELPDEGGRAEIWQLYLKNGVPVETDITAALLAARFTDLSGADIRDMALLAAISAIYRDEQHICLTLQDFTEAYEMIQKRRVKHPQPEITVKHERISAEQYAAETGAANDDKETDSGVSLDL